MNTGRGQEAGPIGSELGGSILFVVYNRVTLI